MDPTFFDPARGPSSGLDLALSAYYNEFLEHWEQQNVSGRGELTEQQRASAAVFIRLAEALTESLHSLRVGERASVAMREIVTAAGSPIAVTPADEVTLARIAPYAPVVRHAVQLDLAYQAVGTLLKTAEHRVFILMELVSERTLSTEAAAYLDRATRLFLWGFDPECIAFSGAVLEAALKKRFPENATRRIQQAVQEGVFSPDQAERADGIRRERNDIVHTQPHPRSDPAEVIKTLAELLDALFPT